MQFVMELPRRNIEGLESISRPLSDTNIIKDGEIRNVLVFVPNDGEKLGESIIDGWPLVVSLVNKFPQATIYVATDFPDMYFSQQFKGKVRPIPPKNLKDLRNEVGGRRWADYPGSEWDNYTLEGMKGKRYLNEFLIDKKIDAIFDIYGWSGAHFQDLRPADFPDNRLPYQFSAFSPAKSIVGYTPRFRWNEDVRTQEPAVPQQDPVFTDRQGREYRISGFRDIVERIAPNESVMDEGVWRYAMEIYSSFGLDVNASSIEPLQLSLKEMNAALTILKELYKNASYSKPFDPLKKIFVINVYAVSQGNLISKAVWAKIIRRLLDETDAYLVFTRGGRMDSDNSLIDEILTMVGKRAENRILLPKIELYPGITDILGVADWALTPDTGLSHLASGVYDKPTCIITRQRVLHWLPPRSENVHTVIADNPTDYSISYRLVHGNPNQSETSRLLDMLHKDVIEDIVRQARMVDEQPTKPDVLAARISSMSIANKAMLDKELLEHQLDKSNFPGAEEDLRSYLKGYLNLLGYGSDLIPNIAYIDTAAQLGIDNPRFKVKLYLEDPRTYYLLIDKRALIQKADGTWAVQDDVKKFDILHEVMGHMLIRSRFPEFEEMHRLAVRTGVDSDEVITAKTIEEALARLMTILAYKMIRQAGIVITNEAIEQQLAMLGVDLDRSDTADYAHAILNNMIAVEEDWNFYSYKSVIDRRSGTKPVIEEVIEKAAELEKTEKPAATPDAEPVDKTTRAGATAVTAESSQTGRVQLITKYSPEVLDSASALLEAVREPSSPRVFFIPVKDYDINAGPYAAIRKYTKDALEAGGFSPKIFFYDGTEDGLRQAYVRAKQEMEDPACLALVYAGKGRYDMVKGVNGVFEKDARVQCVQEDIPEGFMDVYMHVVIGLGFLDFVKYGTFNGRFKSMFENMAVLDGTALADWNNDPVKFITDLLGGKHTLAARVNFKALEDMDRGHKLVAQAA